MEIQKKTRDPALDAVRCVALFFVAGIHFFTYIGYNDVPVVGARMFLMTVMRSAFFAAVPLFLLLSGYLLCGRRPSRGYYRKLIKTLSVYVLASLCCILFRLIYAAVTKEGTVSIPGQLTKILDYSCAPYAWYLEMYLGLFLLAPFLNILYDALESKKQKQCLLLTLLLLTSVPFVVNIFRLFDLQWLLSPRSSSAYHGLLPDWWHGLYPVTCYVLGCYMKEFPPKRSARYYGLMFLALTLAVGVFTVYRSGGLTCVDASWMSWGALNNVALAALVFRFLTSLRYDKLGKGAAALLAKVSDLTLGAFLVSWIFDNTFYRFLKAFEPVPQRRLEYFPLMVLLVLVCSLLLSALLEKLYSLLAAAVSALRKKA